MPPTPAKRTHASQRDIALRRLERQHLVSQTLRSPEDVVRSLVAVQAQDYGNAKWAVAQRGTGISDADVERAIASGTILRTHVLRPTWHFVLPEDIRWLLELTAPRVRAAMASYDRRLSLDPATMRKSNAVLERALGAGRHLTRPELAAALRRAGIAVPTGQHVGHLLMRAELDAVIVSGARRGKQLTWALFDDRVPASPPRERDASLRELTRRYFETRGPATLRDFAWWSGLTVADAKRGVEANVAALERQEIDGVVYWSAPAARQAQRGWRAHFLPNYDEYTVGFRDRSAFAQRMRPARPTPRLDALIGHVLCVDGQVVGVWRRAAGGADLEIRLLVPLSRVDFTLVRQAADRFGDYLGFPLRIRAIR